MSGRLCISLQGAPASSFAVSSSVASDRASAARESRSGVAHSKLRTVIFAQNCNHKVGGNERVLAGLSPSAGKFEAYVGKRHGATARCACSYPADSALNRRRNGHGRRTTDAGIGRQGPNTPLAALDGNGSTSSRRSHIQSGRSEVSEVSETELNISGEKFLNGAEAAVPEVKLVVDMDAVGDVSSRNPSGDLSQRCEMSNGFTGAVQINGATTSVTGGNVASAGDLQSLEDGAFREAGQAVQSFEQPDVAKSESYGLEGPNGAGALPLDENLYGMQPGDLYQFRSIPGVEEEELAAFLDMDGFSDTEQESDSMETEDPGSNDAVQALRRRIALVRSIASHVVARALAGMVRRAQAFRETLQQAAWSGDRSGMAQGQEAAQSWPRAAAAPAGTRGGESKEDAEGSGGVEEDLDEIPWDVIKRIWNHPAFVKFRVSLSMANLTMALPTFLARALPLISSLQFNLQFLTPSQISLPILAPLLFGGGIVFKSVISNLGYVLPRLGMSIVILWVLWGVNHVVQEAILRLRNHGVVDRRVSNVLVLFVELTASAIAVVTVLSTIGVKISSLLVPFFVAIALAGKDVWHNYFAGFFLFAAQPFRPGDTVTMMCGSGHSGPPSMAPSSHVVLGPGWFEGVCESVDLRYTVLRNGRHRLMVPNSHFLQREFLVTDMAPIAPPRPESARWKKMEKEKLRQRGSMPKTSQQRVNPAFRHPGAPVQNFAISPEANSPPNIPFSTTASFSHSPLGWGEQKIPGGLGTVGHHMYSRPETEGYIDPPIYSPPGPSNGGFTSSPQNDWNV